MIINTIIPSEIVIIIEMFTENTALSFKLILYKLDAELNMHNEH